MYHNSKSKHESILGKFYKMLTMCTCFPSNKFLKRYETNILKTWNTTLSENVCLHFIFPTSIVSDRYSRFVGYFWSRLWRFIETKVKKSTTFCPQIDCQSGGEPDHDTYSSWDL